MQKMEFSFDEFAFGSRLIRDLVNQSEYVRPFVSDFYSADTISNSIKQKSFSIDQRNLLVSVLYEQNNSISLSEKSQANINLLKEKNTFTITTGHQLNLLTGPLFSIYKIAQIISICDGLKKSDSTNNYVPVFWMATEDHDFEEINHIHLFGKKIEWKNPQQKDVVAGQMKLDQLASVLDEIESLYQNEELKSKVKSITEIYRQSNNLADATRNLINYLFGEFGVIIIDGNDKKLKEIFKPVFLKEVREELTFNAVSETNFKLEKSGYHQQVFVRNCNLFFIHEDGKRERIIKENDRFLFNNKSHSLEEIEQLIEANPSLFSPNALLRPVYQETVLPNLVYVGGGGEIAYWLQLKKIFENLKMFFPLLRVRDSLILLNQKQVSELDELNLSVLDLQENTDAIIRRITLSRVGNDLDLIDAEAELMKVKSKVMEKVHLVDKNLSTMVEAEFSKMISTLEKIEAKLLKAEKNKDELSGNRIIKLQEKLLPEKHLHERYDSFLPYYLNSPNFIQTVISSMEFESNPKVRLLIL